MSSSAYETLLERVKEITTAHSIESLLDWDQETYMPRRGAAIRAEQVALIAGVAHERQIGEELGGLLAKSESEADRSDPLVAANLREIRRDFDRAVKLPTALVQDLARSVTLAKEAWTKARKESDFGQFAPHLSKLLDLKRQVAERIGWDTEPYDALMDEYEPGAKSAEVQQVFDELRPQLVDLVQSIRDAKRQPKRDVLKLAAPRERQAAFNRVLAEAMGFDFDAGRIDTSTHPFCSGTGPDDVRLTTRYDESFLPTSLFGVLHEAGHGLYEQGLDMSRFGTPLAKSVSLGIHESQSRLWENMVGRSRVFWVPFFPRLQEHFPAFQGVTLDDWYFAINTVEPSLIRVEADEVTYGLHIMLRFGLERRLIADKLAVKDVPDAWNDGMKQLLGVTPPDDARGCLQDIHWSLGIFGYFPTYQLGNLYAAQFFARAMKAIPELDLKIARGELRPLREWLRENIHQHGKRYRADELLQVVTGQTLAPGPYIEYLQRKFKPLYGI